MKTKVALFSAVALAIVAIALPVLQGLHAQKLVGEPAPVAELSKLPAGAPARGFAYLKADSAPTCVECHLEPRTDAPETIFASLPPKPIAAPAGQSAHARMHGWRLGSVLSILGLGLFSVLGTVATAEVDTQEKEGRLRYYPVAAASNIFAGTLVALDAAGNAVEASDTAGLRVIGRAEQTVDNTAGAAGDLSINVKVGVFRYTNSSIHAVAEANKGTIVFVEDDNTVATQSTNSVKAGRVVDLEGAYVWVDTAVAPVVPIAFAITSAQCATTAAIDLPTAEALANDLKAKYNALQTDFAGLVADLKTQGSLK